MADGNTSLIVLWVDDTAIVKKPLAGKTYYFVADAVTGKPVAKANVEFFGWQQSYHDKPPRHEVVTKQFAEFTDADGQVIRRPRAASRRTIQWLITATDRRRAGSPISASPASGTANWYDAEYNATKVYTITDRPVYRPEQTVKYKFWVRHAKYDHGRHVRLRRPDVHRRDPQPQGREDRLEKRRRPTTTAASTANTTLPADATLGVYAARTSQQPRRRQLPRRGVQEARVRGDGRRPRPSRSCSARRSRPRSRPSTTSARR